MKLTLLVGHRGVGKTSLLLRWKEYDPEAICYDLDQEIQNREKKTIDQIFKEKGEKEFRQIEVQTFFSLLSKNHSKMIISCGAGFDLEQAPKNAHVIFVCRDSDSKGRIFIDRPRLEAEISPLEEFKKRYQARHSKFLERADRVYTMPEGLDKANEVEKNILLGKPKFQALITLSEWGVYHRWDGMVYEWRNDLLSEEQFLKFSLEPEQVLYSVRKDGDLPKSVTKSGITIDWDLSRAIPDSEQIKILSTHQLDIERALADLRKYEDKNFHFKLCPQINSWQELKKGHDWQTKDPEKRSFLPRSTDGRWSWYRLLKKGKQKLNFVREGMGSSLDQPTLWEWLSFHPQKVNQFGAVLGDPISHSYSPAFHSDLFTKKLSGFLKIRITETEWGEAMPFLEELGIIACAVTSPLKKWAGQWIGQSTPLNTLGFDSKTQMWKGTNTDLPALEEVLRKFSQNKATVIWGGGGLLPSLQKCLPLAIPFSAREGRARFHLQLDIAPEIFVWAAGGQSEIEKIPLDWRPNVVLDMSYTQDSPARELALRWQADYISGLELFKNQAHRQQDWWKKNIGL